MVQNKYILQWFREFKPKLKVKFMSVGPVQNSIAANGSCFSLFSIIVFQPHWSVNIFFQTPGHEMFPHQPLQRKWCKCRDVRSSLPPLCCPLKCLLECVDVDGHCGLLHARGKLPHYTHSPPLPPAHIHANTDKKPHMFLFDLQESPLEKNRMRLLHVT